MSTPASRKITINYLQNNGIRIGLTQTEPNGGRPVPTDISYDLSNFSMHTRDQDTDLESRCLLAASMLLTHVLKPTAQTINGLLKEFQPKSIHFVLTREREEAIIIKLRIILAGDKELVGQVTKSASLIIEEAETKLPASYLKSVTEMCLYCSLKGYTAKEEQPA